MRYLAGLFDGEGCVTAMREKQKLYLAPMVTVAMTDRAGPEAFQRVFGGTLIRRPGRPNEKPVWTWRRKGGPVVTEVLTALRPYLRVKALEADLILALAARQRGRTGRHLSANEYFLQHALDGLARAQRSKGRR